MLATQAASSGEMVLEELVVTAQKKIESVQNIPVSIAAFGASGIENKGINTLVDLQANVPNMQLTPHPNSATTSRVYIRGVGNSDDQITQDPSVAVYLDGVYMARSQGLAMEVGDIERIEVLRGPQGSLYGRNATGGAVNFLTLNPNLDAVEFKQALTVGNRDLFRSKTSFSTPINDQLAVKLSYLTVTKDGFVDNLGTGEDRFGDQDREAYRFDSLWQATDNLGVRYTYDRSDIDDTPAFIQPVPLYPQTTPRGNEGNAAVSELQANAVISSGHSINVEWEINDSLIMRSITAYRELENYTYQDYMTGVYGPFPIFITNTDAEQDQLSQELQIVGDALDTRLEYIAGIYYFYEQGESTDLTTVPARRTISHRDVETENRAYALFGQTTYTRKFWMSVCTLLSALGGHGTNATQRSPKPANLWTHKS
ncbi:TonB-dependent receptor [Oceanicoccus sp. KOV_DT_Chl]|uniref:TonB-dependent receptor n=1 Tax=Oceanicoccus sp. KOV_DT_Chl TaxID=1904639 RepID=UPI00190E815C|nr:TonB-dependent receptor [Oceanicoccus sp. KOV_DT_Chl]